MTYKPIPTADDMLSSVIKTRDAVLDILSKYPSSKGHYSLLTYYVWRDWHNIHLAGSTFKQLLYAPSPSTIGRAYRKIAEEEREILKQDPMYKPLSLPTDRTLTKRERREQLYRAFYGGGV